MPEATLAVAQEGVPPSTAAGSLAAGVRAIRLMPSLGGAAVFPEPRLPPLPLPPARGSQQHCLISTLRREGPVQGNTDVRDLLQIPNVKQFINSYRVR